MFTSHDIRTKAAFKKNCVVAKGVNLELSGHEVTAGIKKLTRHIAGSLRTSMKGDRNNQ